MNRKRKGILLYMTNPYLHLPETLKCANAQLYLMKSKLTITIDSELVKWIESIMNSSKDFASVSHAIEKAVFEMKAEYEKKKQLGS